MRKTLLLSCYFLRIEILIDYLPIYGFFFKTLISSAGFVFIFGWEQPAEPSWMSSPRSQLQRSSQRLHLTPATSDTLYISSL